MYREYVRPKSVQSEYENVALAHLEAKANKQNKINGSKMDENMNIDVQVEKKQEQEGEQEGEEHEHEHDLKKEEIKKLETQDKFEDEIQNKNAEIDITNVSGIIQYYVQ